MNIFIIIGEFILRGDSMEYNVKIIYKKDEISEKEKIDRVNQFRDAFVTSAVNYYSEINKKKEQRLIGN